MITKIYNDDSSYEVGKDGVVRIKLTNHGTEERPIYKVFYENGDFLFVGLQDHERVEKKIKQ